MTIERGPTLAFRVRGSYACFTRPETKAEPFSYDVMTPSAARGVVKSIVWKPSIEWQIERIHVLSPIKRDQIVRKELRDLPSLKVPFHAPDHHTRKNTTLLRDVDYLVECFFKMTEEAYPDDSVQKFVAIFRRRLENGQCYYPPYLGLREFIADVLPVQSKGSLYFDPVSGNKILPEVAYRDVSIPMGQMLLEPGSEAPIMFSAELKNGILVETGKDRLPEFRSEIHVH